MHGRRLHDVCTKAPPRGRGRARFGIMAPRPMRARAPSSACDVRACFASALLIVLAAACGPATGAAPAQKPGSPPASTEPAREVTTAIAAEMPWERTLRATGELAAFDAATISVKVPGRIEKLDVDVGTRLNRGDVLALIEPRDYDLRRQAAVAALQAARARLGLPLEGDDDKVVPEDAALVKLARAQLDDATRNRDRLVDVAPSGAASKAELDTANSNVLVADARFRDAIEEVQNRRALLSQRRAELSIAEQQLADTRITAPFDGFVRERRASLGDFVQAGAPVVMFVRVDPLRLRLEVPEEDAPLVQKGQKVRVWITGDAKVREGTVARTSPAISERNRTLLVEGEVPNASAELRPGSYVRAEIVVDPNAKALVVPLDALVSFAGVDKMFVVRDGKAVEVRISTGRRDNQRLEIRSGVKAGDVVVRQPGNLQSGTAVRPASAK
jgi:membrane fusion protein, multidrug efflux system